MRKGGILILVLSILVIVLIVFMLDKKTDNKNKLNEINTSQTRIEYNEDQEKYVVYDEKGKKIYNGTSEVEANFYKDNPDFDPMIDQFDSSDAHVGDIEDVQSSGF